MMCSTSAYYFKTVVFISLVLLFNVYCVEALRMNVIAHVLCVLCLLCCVSEPKTNFPCVQSNPVHSCWGISPPSWLHLLFISVISKKKKKSLIVMSGEWEWKKRKKLNGCYWVLWGSLVTATYWTSPVLLVFAVLAAQYSTCVKRHWKKNHSDLERFIQQFVGYNIWRGIYSTYNIGTMI